MGLFDKNKRLEDLLKKADNNLAANYATGTAYLQGLSDDDYAKVLKVVDILRKANKDCADVLGIPQEPTTYITPPVEPEYLDMLLDDKPVKKVPVKA